MVDGPLFENNPLAPDVAPGNLPVRTYLAFFGGRRGDRLSRTIEWVITSLILLNVAALVLESVASIRAACGEWLVMVELGTVTVFTVEYLLRLWSVTAARDYQGPIRGRLRYAVTPFALIDLVSILPLYAALFGHDLRLVSALRMLRLLKLARYSIALQTLGRVLHDKRNEIFAALIILMMLLLLASCGIYLAEADAQPEIFSSIPDSLWWSVVTVTTIGYGDVTPITPMGKIMTGIIAILSILAIALPTGIVSAGFLEEHRRRSLPASCPHCGESIHH